MKLAEEYIERAAEILARACGNTEDAIPEIENAIHAILSAAVLAVAAAEGVSGRQS